MQNLQRNIPMKNDVMFRTFFRDPSNKKFLLDIAKSILIEHNITSIEYNKNLDHLLYEEKNHVLEITGISENNTSFRILFGFNNVFQSVTSTILDENKNSKIILISLLDYNYNDLPEYLTQAITVVKSNRNYVFDSYIEYYYIELKKFRYTIKEIKTNLDCWISFIDMENDKLLSQSIENNKLIAEAFKKYLILKNSYKVQKLIKYIYENEQKNKLLLEKYKNDGYKSGLEEGKKIGFEDGFSKGLTIGKKEGKLQGLKEGKRLALKENK